MPGTSFPCRHLLSRYAAVINGSIGDHENLMVHSDEGEWIPKLHRRQKRSRMRIHFRAAAGSCLSLFSASNLAVKRGRGERGGDRWEGTHVKRRRHFSQNFPLRQFQGRVWHACRSCCPSWGVRGFHSARACRASRAQRGWRVARGEDEPDIRSMNTSLGYHILVNGNVSEMSPF